MSKPYWEQEVPEETTTKKLGFRLYAKAGKQQKAKELREQGWSYPRIARVLGVDHKTIMYWAETQGWEISQPKIVTGADGKQYPAGCGLAKKVSNF